MAISRVKTWAAEILTFNDLNAEYDNILNNALSLISPLTGNLAAGDNDITGLDELAFTSAGAGASASGRLRRNSTRLSWHNGTAAQQIPHSSELGNVLIAAGSASGATLDFTSTVITSTYDKYILELSNFLPATDNADLWIRLSQAASFLSGVADYNWFRQQSTGAGLAETADLSDAQVLVLNATSNVAGETSHATIWFDSLAATAFHHFRWTAQWMTLTPTLAWNTGVGGLLSSTVAVDGIRVMFSSGNIVSGEYALFGVRKTITT